MTRGKRTNYSTFDKINIVIFVILIYFGIFLKLSVFVFFAFLIPFILYLLKYEIQKSFNKSKRRNRASRRRKPTQTRNSRLMNRSNPIQRSMKELPGSRTYISSGVYTTKSLMGYPKNENPDPYADYMDIDRIKSGMYLRSAVHNNIVKVKTVQDHPSGNKRIEFEIDKFGRAYNMHIPSSVGAEYIAQNKFVQVNEDKIVHIRNLKQGMTVRSFGTRGQFVIIMDVRLSLSNAWLSIATQNGISSWQVSTSEIFELR
ncbi:MAG: hypothetical protein ACXAD7_00290 [Candidatus Kariarchaeaceae archaeon]